VCRVRDFFKLPVSFPVEDSLARLDERLQRMEALHALELCRLTRPGTRGAAFAVTDGELRAVALAVADAWLLSLDELRTERRTQPMALARQAAFWLQRELTGADGERIGIWWGGKHRTTVNYGIAQMTRRLRGGDAALQSVVRGIAAHFRKEAQA